MNPTKQIDTHIASLTDWRGTMIARLRTLIHEVDPDIQEEWKWTTPVFSHKGMVCALGDFKNHVKINFFQGAALSDPNKLFNAGLDSKKTRGIDLFENDEIPEAAIKELFIAAVAYNQNK